MLGNFANLTGYADAMQQYVREEFAPDGVTGRLRVKPVMSSDMLAQPLLKPNADGKGALKSQRLD